MKNPIHCLFSSASRQSLNAAKFNPWLATSLAILLAMPLTHAASFTWDASGGNPTAPTDGDGTWNTTAAANWSDGTTNFDWTNDSHIAVFGSNNGAAGTVTLGTGIAVGGITFNSATSGIYSVAGAGNTLTFDGTAAISTVTTNANATINAPLAISGSVATLTKAGPGILELGGGGTVTHIRSGPITGSLFITDGTYSVAGINFYDKGIVSDDDGVLFQTGGTIVTTPKDWDGRFTASPYDITGGSLTVTTVNRIRGIGNFNASGSAVVTFNTNDARISSDNYSGTLSINGDASVTFSSNTLLNLVNSASGASGVVNLGGGTLTAAVIHNGGGATTTGFVNFNGGTLKASGGGAGFFNANPLTTVSIYGGGAFVDSNGLNIGINQALLGTTGNGVDAAIVTDGGSAYATAPNVTFNGGGGTGATGYALINTSGVVTGIVITNPGVNYTSAPTVSFDSGAATATATAALANVNGGFTKNGLGTLTLNGANTYTGATTINDGTLTYNAPGLLDASTVRINGDGTLNLNFSGTDTVAALFIDNVQMPDGTYDSNHGSGCFIGNGILSVGGPVASPYAAWESTNGITDAGADADSDDDGIANGIEFVIGGDPSGPDSDSNSLMQPVAVDENNLTFVFRRTTASASYNPFVEYSTDLSTWTKAEAGVNNVTTTVETGFYGTGIDKVAVVIPRDPGSGSKLFARLKVIIP